MDFNTVAKEIVSDSICSALCIDNAFDEPYAPTDYPEKDSFKIPKELYESFKAQNCILDIYKYIDLKDWEGKRESILKNKDLLILDWELTDGDPPYKDALEILLEAVKTESLPFVYIYTQEIDLDKVILNICAYFSGTTSEDLRQKYESLCEELEDTTDIPEVEDSDKLLSGMKEICKEILIKGDLSEDIEDEIFGYLQKELDTDLGGAKRYYRTLCKIGQKHFETETRDDIFKPIGIILNPSHCREEPVSEIDIHPISDEQYAYLIHNTIVKISTKKLSTTEGIKSDVVSPEEVYSDLSRTIWKRPRNFLALLGLEMRNLYRGRSSVIGKDLNEIDEIAFFKHQKSFEDTDEQERFYEFLKNIWKEELSSFLLDQSPALFSVLDEYKNKNNIEDGLETLQKNPEKFIDDLSKLNYYYSVLRFDWKNPRKIRFGDIFSITFEKNGDSEEDYSYLLCITSHCDCLRPQKVEDSLNFVGGKKLKLKKGLEIGDSGCVSYIKANEEIVCIEWRKIPFTIHIALNGNDISKPIKCIFSGRDITLDYLATQKENYTQRIANAAFSYASRVGIELVGL